MRARRIEWRGRRGRSGLEERRDGGLKLAGVEMGGGGVLGSGDEEMAKELGD